MPSYFSLPTKIKKLTLLLLSALALSCLSFISLAANSQQVIRQLEELNAQQDYQAAYQLGHSNLEQLAGNPEFDLAFGTAAANVGEEDHAIFAFERVLVYQKDLQAARENLAQSHIKKGNLTAANKHLGKTNTFNTLAAAANLQAINPYLSHKSLKYLNHKIANRKAMFIAQAGMGAGVVSSEQGLTSTYSLPFLTHYTHYPSNKTSSYNSYTLGTGLLFAFSPRFGIQTLAQADVTNPHNLGVLEPTTQAGKTEINFYWLGNTWALSLPINYSKQQREFTNDFYVNKNEQEALSLSLKAYKKLNATNGLLMQAGLLVIDERFALATQADEHTPLGREADNSFAYFQLNWLAQPTPNWHLITSLGGGTKGETELKGCWECFDTGESYLHPSLSRVKTFSLTNSWRLSSLAKLNLGAVISSGKLANFVSYQEKHQHTFNQFKFNLGLTVTSRNQWQTQVDINQLFTRNTTQNLDDTHLTNINLAIKKLW